MMSAAAAERWMLESHGQTSESTRQNLESDFSGPES
jgi:hypothetical protein